LRLCLQKFYEFKEITEHIAFDYPASTEIEGALNELEHRIKEELRDRELWLMLEARES